MSVPTPQTEEQKREYWKKRIMDRLTSIAKDLQPEWKTVMENCRHIGMDEKKLERIDKQLNTVMTDIFMEVQIFGLKIEVPESKEEQKEPTK